MGKTRFSSETVRSPAPWEDQQGTQGYGSWPEGVRVVRTAHGDFEFVGKTMIIGSGEISNYRSVYPGIAETRLAHIKECLRWITRVAPSREEGEALTQPVAAQQLIYQHLPGRIRQIIDDEVLIEFETPEGVIEEVFSKDQFDNPESIREGMAVRALNKLVTDPSRDKLTQEQKATLDNVLDRLEKYEKKAKTKPTIKVKS